MWKSQSDSKKHWNLQEATAMQPPHQPRYRVRDNAEEAATAFLDKVKQRFRDQPDVFRQFLTALRACHTQSITVHSLTLQVSELFRGHADLVEGLKTFFPVTSMTPMGFLPEYRDEAEEKANSYVDLVKHHLRDHPNEFRRFLSVMHGFHVRTIDLDTTIKCVSELLHGSPELILGFNAFLPPDVRFGPDLQLVSRY